MSVSMASTSTISSATSINVPDSTGFIGNADDAVILQMIVLISTGDRMRDTIRDDLSGTERIVNAIDALADSLNRFGKLVKSSWVPVTYASLTSSAKNASTLKDLFAADGPNLGDTLVDSNAELEELNSNGIALDAPKKTPVMVENFSVVNGKINFNEAPALSSLGWQSDQDLRAINPGATTGSYPGSVVKTVENRDSNNKLVSITRYTVFVDYANLRPKAEDMQASFSELQKNIIPLLAVLESAIAQVKAKKDSLDDRMRNEMSKVTDDQKIVDSLRKSQSDSLLESLRLVRVYRAELENRLLRSEKSLMKDSKSYDFLRQASVTTIKQQDSSSKAAS